MAKVAKRGPGRPAVFGAAEIKLILAAVRSAGSASAAMTVLRKKRGKFGAISMPTILKLVHGAGLKLAVGRPKEGETALGRAAKTTKKSKKAAKSTKATGSKKAPKRTRKVASPVAAATVEEPASDVVEELTAAVQAA